MASTAFGSTGGAWSDAYRCTTIDEDRIYHEVQAAGEAIVARTGLPVKSRWPVV